MKKLFFIFILISVTCFVWADNRNCAKQFQVIGPDGRTMSLSVTNRLYELDATGLKKNEDLAAYKYEGHDYAKIGPATARQDCAGYVLDRLWNTGPYFVTAEKLYDSVIKPFGKPVSFEKAQRGDIVRWGNGGHVAIVRAVTGGKIIIETKDRAEPVFLHTLDPYDETDPLNNNYQQPTLYRVSADAVQLKSVPSECDTAESAKKVDERFVGSWTCPAKITLVFQADGQGAWVDKRDGAPGSMSAPGEFWGTWSSTGDNVTLVTSTEKYGNRGGTVEFRFLDGKLHDDWGDVYTKD